MFNWQVQTLVRTTQDLCFTKIEIFNFKLVGCEYRIALLGCAPVLSMKVLCIIEGAS
ncbi:hypothetical protein BDZ94DRAFT_1277249 [Collybia nuda]|uniref:Uncharacterized protein n=1 Tax=Collybia nuda TaxID=64659 RepID=A0A9P5XU85_9AGAR|nr:hypothetical protein BDZ94DRAFT_1277249 [Collybia nuda]